MCIYHTFLVKLTMAPPRGCSLWYSARPTMAVNSREEHTASETNRTTSVTSGRPVERVPVLSNTTVVTWTITCTNIDIPPLTVSHTHTHTL